MPILVAVSNCRRLERDSFTRSKARDYTLTQDWINSFTPPIDRAYLVESRKNARSIDRAALALG